MMRLICLALTLLLATLVVPSELRSQEPVTLMGLIAEWRYPNSEIHGAQMSDGATVNREGRRTVPSTQCKTVMITPDPIAKVMDYYRSRLTTNSPLNDLKFSDKRVADSGRSVTFHSGLENHPSAIHIIHVNTESTSTILVITRVESESKTYIAWTQYARK